MASLRQNNFFVSQSRKTSAEEGDPPDIRTAQASTSITKFTTSVAKVAKLLSRIDTSKSTSPDCITARVLRLASDELAPYINKVFELSFETGELPRTWKDAVVTLVYKKGDRSNPGNYRPISLLSATSKVLEKIVCEQLGEQVERHLPEKQSGFRKADGTVPQLTRLLHTMYEALDNGKNVFAVFYDLSKAFDRVWHRGLLAKMEHLGVTGKALNWVAGYLQDRRQKVQLEEASSSWQSIPAGVPQGSILGPLFFLIYTHDLPDAVEAGVECDQFADDTALLSIHSNRDAAVANMQLGVNDTTRWLDDWRLQVNVLKTYAMEITRSTLPHPKPHILLGGSRLEVTSRQKHLGLVITATLSWKEHIASILQKAARVLGFSSTPQAFSLSSCTADDLHLLHPPHSRICLSHVEQLDEERGRPAGTIPATSCSPHPWHTAFQEGRPLTSADSSQPPDVRVSQSLRTRGIRTAVVYWSSPQPPQGHEPAKTCGNV